MNTLEIADGCIVIGNKNCVMVGTITPFPDGYWVGLGHPNHEGILVDSESWDSFVQLVKDIDTYIKVYHENLHN